MEGFLLFQLFCICFPAILALLVWGVVAITYPGQVKFAIRFDLTTLLMLMTAIGVILMFSKAAEKSIIREYERVMIGMASAFTLPVIWLIQITLDEFRDQRRKREERKRQQLELNLPSAAPTKGTNPDQDDNS